MKGDIDTIEAHGKHYRIENPGGRVGSKISSGTAYESKLLERIYELGLAGSAFDVGAFVGNHSLWLARICGLRVHAFEPHLAAFSALVANVKRNRLGQRVSCHNVAAGAAPGRAQFRSTMTLKLNRGEVPVARIDDLVSVDDLSVVKVDVEGMESHALAGMADHLARCRPVVFAEVHTPQSHDLVAAVLAPLGFEHVDSVRMGSVMEEWRCV